MHASGNTTTPTTSIVAFHLGRKCPLIASPTTPPPEFSGCLAAPTGFTCCQRDPAGRSSGGCGLLSGPEQACCASAKHSNEVVVCADGCTGGMRACHAPDPASPTGAAMPCNPTDLPPATQVIITTGPTAVGKTAVGLLLAERLGGEVISADSVQVYRGLDVGSDKLPVAQRRGVPHHLIDIRDVGQNYSAGDFSDEANAAIQDILARGRVPIVVGGTGFYLKCLMQGKPKGPRTSPEALAAVRAKVLQVWRSASAAASAQAGCTTPTQDAQPSPTTAAGAVAAATAAQEPAAGLSPPGGGGAGSPGPRAGQSPLQHVEVEGLDAAAKWQLACGLLGQAGDPVTQQRVLGERNNYYRLERALVLLHLTGGTPLADLDWASSSGSDSEGGEETSTGAGPDGMGRQRAVQWRPFFLHRPRLALYSRIEGRVEEMVLGGLVQEAAQLLLGGHGPDSSAATRAIGYKQAMDWLLQATPVFLSRIALLGSYNGGCRVALCLRIVGGEILALPGPPVLPASGVKARPRLPGAFQEASSTLLDTLVVGFSREPLKRAFAKTGLYPPNKEQLLAAAKASIQGGKGMATLAPWKRLTVTNDMMVTVAAVRRSAEEQPPLYFRAVDQFYNRQELEEQVSIRAAKYGGGARVLCRAEGMAGRGAREGYEEHGAHSSPRYCLLALRPAWPLQLVLEQPATGAYTGKQEECQEGCANPLPQPLAHTKTSAATLQPPQQLWPPAQQEVTQQGRGEGQQQPGLTSQGPLAAGDPPGRCWSVGVREVEALVRAVCAATHKLVRHQMTWFRDSSEYKWLDMDALGNTEAAVDAILQELALPQHQGAPAPPRPTPLSNWVFLMGRKQQGRHGRAAGTWQWAAVEPGLPLPDAAGGCAPGSGRLEADEARSLRQRPLALSSTQGGGEAVALQLHLINSQLLPRLAADAGVRRMVEARAALQQRQAEEAEAREQAKQARRRQVALEHKARHRQQANQPAGVRLKEGQG
ncbi:hypothetical protein QJQ45_028663 [Haematococcus lacustris]|nr:hypothetical protein QJQ45_028663 [Haematococcus lacustris]